MFKKVIDNPQLEINLNKELRYTESKELIAHDGVVDITINGMWLPWGIDWIMFISQFEVGRCPTLKKTSNNKSSISSR